MRTLKDWARPFARGFTQSYGIDYQVTFATVAKLNTIRIILPLAANLDWGLQQLDIKNVSLNGDLEVYMDIPPGYKEKFDPTKVCKLKKPLCGLEQSPCVWFGRFATFVLNLGIHNVS